MSSKYFARLVHALVSLDIPEDEALEIANQTDPIFYERISLSEILEIANVLRLEHLRVL